jgi:hypothetical protein
VDEHRPCKTTDVKMILLFLLVSSELLNFEDEISIRRGECSDPNIYLSISGIVKGLIWTLGH